MQRILIVASTTDAKTAASCFPAQARIDIEHQTSGIRARLEEKTYDLVFLDIQLLKPEHGDDKTGGVRRITRLVWNKNPVAEVIVLCPAERIREAVNAVKEGAGNYLTLPLDPIEVRYVLNSMREVRRLEEQLDYFRKITGSSSQENVVGTTNPVMDDVFKKARMVAPTDSTVLLAGETGVGKGVIARLIHSLSERGRGPFVSVHCGAIPETLIESELFGHEKGSFTGAIRRKLGRFEIAAGGTIFLDEVGTIGEPTQVKLLQVLQDKCFHRVGGDADICVNTRVIAASNIDLKAECERGRFRKDLYFRLNIFPINIPPLRERKEDIPRLAEHILSKLNKTHPKTVDGIHPAVLDAFAHYPWPGNVRELENLMERAHILETSHMLTPEVFPSELFENESLAIPVDASLSLHAFRERAKNEAERVYLKDVLTRHEGRIGQTAEAAGITPRQLNKLMTKHNLHKEDFKKERRREKTGEPDIKITSA
ncbi:sigma-54 dependent transcriptional regulator [Desulfovibrio inopinatus]|uniref:sigma-54 dependent transcriptional regulator n=1 Tax=Desulfovibrio inopinatus TaxID=102109 RepID=UPI000414F7FC|nr:sigma-54 dependent transcriptional regulator [Desulfovibrio inopinatus]